MKYINIFYVLVIMCVSKYLAGMQALVEQPPISLAKAIQSYDVDFVDQWMRNGRKVDYFFASIENQGLKKILWH